MREIPAVDAAVLQERLVAFIRAFGLHQPEQTPCGQPITVSEAHALIELARDAPFSQAELARRLNLEKSTVSRLVGQLSSRGWVQRGSDPHDGRAALLTLTDSGSKAAANLNAARQAKFGALLQAIPEADRPAVLEALKILTKALS
jgi:DNA-binding MarR family transcriptional regulator